MAGIGVFWNSFLSIYIHFNDLNGSLFIKRLFGFPTQAEVKLGEYHKLARKLKLIPASAENACGQDFEIKVTTDCGPSMITQYKVQIEVRSHGPASHRYSDPFPHRFV